MTYSVLGNLFLYLGQVLIARELPRADYASYAVVVSLVSLVAMLGDLGWTPYLVPQLVNASTKESKLRRAEIGELLGSALITKLVLAMLCSVLAAALGYLLYGSERGMLTLIMVSAFFISSRLAVVRTIMEAYARSRGRYDLVTRLIAIDAAMFTVLLFVLSQYELSLIQVVIIYSLCHLPGFVCLAIDLVRALREQRIRLRFDQKALSGIFRRAMPVTLGICFLAIHNMSDALILEFLSTDIEVAKYSASVRLLSALVFLPMVLGYVVGPEITRLISHHEHSRAADIIRTVLQYLVLFSIACGCVLWYLADFVTPLVLGEQYSDTVRSVQLLGLMFVPLAVSAYLLEIAFAIDAAKAFTRYALTLAVITVVGDVLVAGAYGSEGVMLVRATASVAGCVSLFLFLNHTSEVTRSGMQLKWIAFLLVALMGMLGGYAAAHVGLNWLVQSAMALLVLLLVAWTLKLVELRSLRSIAGALRGERP